MVSPAENSSSRISTTSVDSADSGRNEAVSSCVSSASFETEGARTMSRTTQMARTTHLVRRPATNEASADMVRRANLADRFMELQTIV